ncbi:sensor histidine kinase [Nocardioides guangzhouensis]|uniref:Oxygen sensor histidine kinase NreB n=1 Tax=Nocardioides guangzhouensis TaxID=2497878 RepID=A0A4Q4ZBS9_9ACTN|nr:sensor histidine kinase [Nocardioides guangzhouensis]RYP85382.1 sensor histidine kinase [Nocardioides guangzhouensis]
MQAWHRWAAVTAAWAAPLAWVTIALFSGPSDGTVVSSPTAWAGAARWDQTVTVLRTYGDTRLREGDRLLEVDGRSLADWADADPLPDRATGERLTYVVLRSARGLDRNLEVDVVLARYPLGPALGGNLPVLLASGGLLLAASFAHWRRPRDPAVVAVLVAASATAGATTAYPFGTGAVDLAGGRGLWPAAGGEMALAAAAAAGLVAAWTFPYPHGPARHRRGAWPVAVAVPLLGIAAWEVAVALSHESGLGRLQATATLALPALAATAPLVVLGLVVGYARAPSREDRIALRLVLWVAVTATVVRLMLYDVPALVGGEPLLSGDLLALVLLPLVLAGLVVALLRTQLNEIDSALRRSLVQLVVATLLAAAFLAATGVVGRASETSFGSMVVGGVVALLLVPVANAVRRALTSLVYGDRDFPYRVVSDLRRLDPAAPPDAALHELLEVLSRSLRLSYASIELAPGPDGGGVSTAIGEPRGQVTSVDLSAGGTVLGVLRLEVEPSRDPFGPRDRRLLEDVGSQVGALVQAVLLNRDLQRSRERLVAAREEERRRVRRDLHDGLGPSLASLAMNLDLARDLISTDPEAASGLVGRLADQAERDIGEVRRLVDGLRPPALDQLGLVPALRQRADEHNLAAEDGRRDRMQWSVTSSGDLSGLPAAVEVAAYRIVVEAVNNAQRHSRAGACAVTVSRDDGTLLLEVEDTGVGLPDAPGTGVGLASMRERAEELGGSFAVTSGAAGGTLVRVRLPVSPAQSPSPSNENVR